MHRSTHRILTTHCGSLPRPTDLLDLMKAKINGQPYDADAYAARVRSAVAEMVRQQLDCGIDIPTDGEQSKPGFFAYVNERLAGFEPRPGPRPAMFQTEVEAFPEYYKQYFSTAMLGVTLAPLVPFVCTGPVSYRGQEAVRRDIENLKAALRGAGARRRFHAGGSAERGGKERILRHRQRIYARCGGGAEQRVPGDCRCRLPAANRRSVSHRTLQLLVPGAQPRSGTLPRTMSKR